MLLLHFPMHRHCRRGQRITNLAATAATAVAVLIAVLGAEEAMPLPNWLVPIIGVALVVSLSAFFGCRSQRNLARNEKRSAWMWILSPGLPRFRVYYAGAMECGAKRRTSPLNLPANTGQPCTGRTAMPEFPMSSARRSNSPSGCRSTPAKR